MTRSAYHRRGSSYLEIQVAMVLLSIGMAGLYSMSVVQTRQTRRLRDVLPPNEVPALNRADDQWARKLGAYANLDAVITPITSLPPYTYAERVIDNVDPGLDGDVKFHQDKLDSHGWTPWSYYRTYRGSAHYHYSRGNRGSFAEFRIKNLPPGEYEVLTTYPSLSSLGRAIPHAIFDDKQLRAVVRVNQRVTPSDVTYDGRGWNRLAVIQCDSGKIRVQMRDSPTSRYYVIADAVLIRSARSFELLSVDRTPGGGATAVLEAP